MSSVVYGNMPTEVYVVVHMSKNVITDTNRCTTKVSNELSLRHLVLHMWAAQVHAE